MDRGRQRGVCKDQWQLRCGDRRSTTAGAQQLRHCRKHCRSHRLFTPWRSRSAPHRHRGHDYWIWNALQPKPRVVVVEYNARFRPPTKWVMKYNPKHQWNSSDCHGAWVESLSVLAQQKGYSLVGCCLAGVNAFFVRDDLLKDQFEAPDAAALYNPPRYYLQRFLPAGHATGPFGPYESR